MGRNTLRLSTTGLERMLSEFDKLGGNVERVAMDALEQAGETIGEDTFAAVQPGNLPAGGRYSGGQTAASVVRHPKPVNEGDKISIGVGFDYDKPGAGGYLISGRPNTSGTGFMKPVYELERIYKRKKYIAQIQKDMMDVVQDAIHDVMGGK